MTNTRLLAPSNECRFKVTNQKIQFIEVKSDSIGSVALMKAKTHANIYSCNNQQEVSNT